MVNSTLLAVDNSTFLYSGMSSMLFIFPLNFVIVEYPFMGVLCPNWANYPLSNHVCYWTLLIFPMIHVSVKKKNSVELKDKQNLGHVQQN